jgi:hypothetical protein
VCVSVRVCVSQGKHACRTLAAFGQSSAAAVQRLMKELTASTTLDVTNDTLPTVLSSLAAFALGAHKLFTDNRGQTAVDFVLQDVMSEDGLTLACGSSAAAGAGSAKGRASTGMRRSEAMKRLELAQYALPVCSNPRAYVVCVRACSFAWKCVR